ncbi:hypothetical protein MKK69_03425 [Methylobacterium sp. J-026]|uniref:hypothetical protein n=1 Tax=Methylobacterium sp. J-026 TaxID=2836624 RepID=UPI001FBAFB4E|nr:hypothetical protein [Methylobacterium sp. J-026]MCJ2133123.1 hypothetical protein [Methylobacterium sp. J-026]
MRNATVRDEVAFAAGIKPVRQTALTAAVTLETHEGSTCVRDCTAIQALQDFAEDLDVPVLGHLKPRWADCSHTRLIPIDPPPTSRG